MANVKGQVEQLVTPIVETLGCEVVEVAFEKLHNGMNLTVYIDKPGGVTINDCEAVHLAIDEPLDELNPTNDEPYTLNVSSPGLDREIKSDKDFKRNLNQILEVNLFKKVGKDKKYVGELINFDADAITLKNKKGEEIILKRELISKATKYIEF